MIVMDCARQHGKAATLAGVHDALAAAAENAAQRWCDRVVSALRLGLDLEAAKAQALPYLKQLGSLGGDSSAADLVYVRVGP